MLYICVQLLGGLVLGYLQATLAESFFHRHIQHASSSVRKLWLRYPRLFGPFLRAYYSHHVIHHARTFRQDFITQFRDSAEQQRVDSSIPAQLLERIRRERYGLTMKGWRVLYFLLPVLPLVPLTYLLFGGWVTLGTLFPLLVVYPLFSGWIHPMLHVMHEVALHQTNWLGRLLLRSRFMRKTLRDHWMHHTYVNCNYNLLIGGDYLLGVHRDPTTRDLQEMQRVGIPMN
jgi:hypothetical protein